jgi:hypothetical protein
VPAGAFAGADAPPEATLHQSLNLSRLSLEAWAHPGPVLTLPQRLTREPPKSLVVRLYFAAALT